MSVSRVKNHVVPVADGAYAAVSAEAALLLEAQRSGRPLNEVARELSALLGTDVTERDASSALSVLNEKIGTMAPRAKKRDVFHLFEIPLLPARLVAPVASTMTWLFKPAIALGVTLGALAAVVASFVSGAVMPHGVASAEQWVFAYVLFLVTVAFHEFGHASASCAFGVRPRAIGVTAYFIFPAFYSDVSDAWSLSAKQRLVVDVGGIYFQSIPLAVIAVIAGLTGDPAFCRAELFVLGSIALNLNPVLRFDGYWMLADALDVPNMKREAMRVLYAWATLRAPDARGLRSGKIVALGAFGLLDLVAWGYFIGLSIVVLAKDGPARVVQYATMLRAGTLTVSDVLTLVAVLTSFLIMAVGLGRLVQSIVRALRHRVSGLQSAPVRPAA